MSQQHASVSQGQICVDNHTCCHTEIEVALPGALCFRVSAGTGWPSISILCQVEIESLICSFYLSVAAHTIV